MSTRFPRSFAWVLVVLTAVAACTVKEEKTISKDQLDSVGKSLVKVGDTANPFMRPSAHRYGPPTGKIRIANLLDINGQPSGPVDLYDIRLPDSTATPLIAHLAYGQLSDYVSPRAADAYPGSRSNLYVFPAGSRQATAPFGNSIDNIGFEAPDQLTIALGPVRGMDGGPGIAMVTLTETGHRTNAMTLDSMHAVPAGGGLLIAREANMTADSLPEQYLLIDGMCPRPSYVGEVMLQRTSAGTHTLGVVTSPAGHGLKDCVGKHPGATSTVNVAAGQRYAVFLYGLSSDGFKILAAPIAGP